MEKQEENWKTIENFQDYMISDKGRVWSYKKKSNRILSPGKNKEGYLHVRLSKNGKVMINKIHKLVAEHFIPNPEGYPEVHHIDECKTNNKVSNLQWVSHDYNVEFSKAGYYVLYGPNDERLEIYNLAKFARQNGLDDGQLFGVINGKENSCMGYTRKPGTKLQRMGSFRLLSPEGKVFTFNKQQEAAEYLDVTQSHISQLVLGILKSCKGWKLYPLDGIFAFT